ncbi:MAG: hypothetical protein V7K85_24280 [Nostoc sp.]
MTLRCWGFPGYNPTQKPSYVQRLLIGKASVGGVYTFTTMILRLYNKIHTSNQ